MKSGAHYRWWRTLTLLTLLAMILAACGGTTDQAATTPEPAQTAAPATEATIAPATEATTAPATEATTEMTAEATAEMTSEATTEATTAAAGGAEETATTEATSMAGETATADAGGTATATADETATADAGATATTGAAAGGTDAGPTLNANVSGTVNLWHFWGSPLRRNAIRRVVAICQQQLPNIQITETFKPFGEMYTAHIAAVAAGSGMADVIVEDRPLLPQRAADQIDISLQEFATRDGITGEEFWPFTWNQTLYEGETYGIPYETDVRVLFYNKTAFEEAGLDPNKPPTTWDELEQYADKLDKVNGETIERMGFSPLIGNVGPDVWAVTNGVELIDDQGQPHLNDPAMVETVTWMKGWLDRYGGYQNHQNFRANFTAPPNDEFMSGKVAMKVDINGYSAQINFFRPKNKNAAGEDVEMQWGVAPIPYNKTPGSTSGGFALSIPRGSPNAEAAWEFIKCATGPEAQSSWARDTYSMPARVDAAQDPVLLADPNWQFFVDAMETSSSGRYVAAYPNWGQELGNRYESIWTGEAEVQAALDEAQEAVELEMGQ